jgi:C-terminal processing protease CtpA/Prc
LRSFSGLPESGATCIAAMNFVANADALIIDLRNNGGGSIVMGNLLSSYLFDGKNHLYDIYFRGGNKTESFYTSPEVVGTRFGGRKPVIIVTGHKTFSCAEGFTYSLRHLDRATIVGETTGGGAHTVTDIRIDEHFGIRVPVGQVIVPNSTIDWEGTGIEPDVKVPARLAVKAAHLLALDKILAASPPGSRHDALERTRQVVSQYKIGP